jgi:hypothetical protein
VNSSVITFQNLAELEHYEHLEEAHLSWSQGPSLEKALSVLKRYTNWRQLTLTNKNISLICQRASLFHNEIETSRIVAHPRNIPNCDRFKSPTDIVSQ